MATYALATKVNEAASELIKQLRLYTEYLASEIDYCQGHGENDLADDLFHELQGVGDDIKSLDKFTLHE